MFYPPWTDEELDIIHKYGVKESAEELQKRLPNRTIIAINGRRSKLGVKSILKASRNSGKVVRTGEYLSININGRYKAVHRIVMEKHIGRELKAGERIHHIDCDKLNNDISNLYLCKEEGDHGKVHRSIHSILKPLFREGILSFNQKEGTYIVNI